MEDPMNNVFTEIEINATIEEVWNVLTDWKRMQEWSTSLLGISTEELSKGQSFLVYFKNPLSGKVLEFERVCSEYEEGLKFGWSGKIIGNTNDHHVFTLVRLENDHTLFKQEDGMHGQHSTFMNFLSKHHMDVIYKKFNKQLKDRVESLYPKINKSLNRNRGV